jgi:hypothetical protein
MRTMVAKRTGSEEDDGDAAWLSPEEIMHALDKAAAAVVSGLGQLMRARAAISKNFEELV